jgi:hypothetical protein
MVDRDAEAVEIEGDRVVEVIRRQGAQAARGQELFLVE